MIEAIAAGEGEVGGRAGGRGGRPRRGRGRRARRRPRPAAGAADPAGDPGVHRAGPAGGGRRPAAVPAVRPAARPARVTCAPGTTATTGDRDRRGPSPVLDRGRRPRAAARAGEFELEGRLVDASNTTLRGRDHPGRGDAPGASTSRCAASGRCGTSRTARSPAARSPRTWCPRATGWGVVPPTVLRDGPLGAGRLPAVDRRAGRRRAAGRLRAGVRAAGRLVPDRAAPATRTATRTRWPTPTTPGWPGWPSSTR